jgi:hypothetical protein
VNIGTYIAVAVAMVLGSLLKPAARGFFLDGGRTMMAEHWFWWLLTAACVVWYSTITVYVAIRGALDIQHMLARLAETQDAEARR